MKTQNKTKGFTLIELMIAVAIVGILASIAVPSYQAYVLRSNRAAATACVMELSQAAERFYTQNLRYTGFVIPALQCRNDLTERYAFSVTNLAARTYTIQATPTTRQQDGCGNLTYNQTGAKGANGGTAAADIARCW